MLLRFHFSHQQVLFPNLLLPHCIDSRLLLLLLIKHRLRLFALDYLFCQGLLCVLFDFLSVLELLFKHQFLSILPDLLFHTLLLLSQLRFVLLRFNKSVEVFVVNYILLLMGLFLRLHVPVFIVSPRVEFVLWRRPRLNILHLDGVGGWVRIYLNVVNGGAAVIQIKRRQRLRSQAVKGLRRRQNLNWVTISQNIWKLFVAANSVQNVISRLINPPSRLLLPTCWSLRCQLNVTLG